MKTKLLLLISVLVLAGCASEGKVVNSKLRDSVCGENYSNYTSGTLSYRTKNKFEVSLKLRFEVDGLSELRLKLKPKDDDSDDANIKIIGVSGKLPDNTNTPFGWLDKEGKAADFDKSTMIFCVPDVPEGTRYKFDAEIDGIGTITTIDPRVDVTQ